MPRIRSLHPGQWKDESFVELSPNARLLCLGLRNLADDNGVFEWKPKQIKMELFSADNVDVGPLLDELSATNHVHRYEESSKQYGVIRNFRRWQRPEKPKSWHPLPESLRAYAGLVVDQSTTDRQFPSQRKEEGGERKEIKEPPLVPPGGETKPVVEKKSRKKAATALDPSWKPGTVEYEFATTHGFSRSWVDGEWQMFTSHHEKMGSMFASWPAAWRTWVMKAEKIAQERPAPPLRSENRYGPAAKPSGGVADAEKFDREFKIQWAGRVAPNGVRYPLCDDQGRPLKDANGKVLFEAPANDPDIGDMPVFMRRAGQ